MEHLSKNSFLIKYKTYKGLIPVAIVSDKIIWQDMGTYHFYEGFFFKSLQLYRALTVDKEPTTFSTAIDLLKDPELIDNYIYPTGFIFHAGRSGSTLLAKALGRSKENLIISEASAQNSIWEFFTNNGSKPLLLTDENKVIYRNLILAMGRRRTAWNKYYFIKFTSVNIHFFDFIHQVFLDVPAVFLKRDVNEIVCSWEKGLPGWLNRGNRDLSALDKLVAGNLIQNVEAFLQKANQYPSSILKQLDYKMLTAENLELILSYFNFKPDESQLQLMRSQFSFDSKTELKKRLFEGNS